jgi:AcrR family transcriptional regulator
VTGTQFSEQELKRPPFTPVRQRRSSKNSNDFVAAALKVCEQEGPGSITARRIAKAMSLSPMALYRHFKSMDHLLAMVWNEGFARLDEMIRLPFREGRYDLAAFRRSIELYIEFGLKNPGLYQFMFSAGPRPEEFGLNNEGLKSYQFLVDQVKRLAQNGTLAPELDVQTASLHTWFVLHGMTSLAISKQIGKVSDQDLDSIINDSVDKLLYSLERRVTN